MSTQFAVDLIFGVKDKGINKLHSELTKIENAAKKVGGASFERLGQSVDKVRASVSRLAPSMDRVRASAAKLRGELGGIAGVAATIGAGALVRNFAQIGEASANSQRRLKFLTQEYGELEQAQKSLVRIQQQTGQSAMDARDGFTGLYTSLRPTGVSLKQIETAFIGFDKAARRSGAGTQELNAGLLQLKQALGSGLLQGDELRSIAENTPAISQAIAGVLGVAVGEIKQLGSEGKITSEVVLQALTNLADGTAPPLSAIHATTKRMEGLCRNR